MTSTLRTVKLRAENDRLRRDLEQERKHSGKLVEQLELARGAKRWTPPRPVKPRRRKRDLVRVCVGDTHGCKADKAALRAFLSDLRELDPDEIVLGGDHVDCGGFLAQHHVMGYVSETAYTYEDDIHAANRFLDAVQQHAPRASIEYLEGNHDQRVEKWCITQTLRNSRDAEFLRKAFAPAYLLRLKERGIPYYQRDRVHGDCRIPGWIRKGKCFFVHQISSARHAAAAAVQTTAGNVVYFHTHRADSAMMNFPNVGLCAAWSPGCMSELQPAWRHTSPTHWTQGYAVQLVAPSGAFLHINVPIADGQSLLLPMMGRGTAHGTGKEGGARE